jgi:toxin ParE1/3/4
MARLVRSPQARRDVAEVLAYTRQRWGTEQALAYAALIREALEALIANPRTGKPRGELGLGVLAHHIAQRGRPARHVLFYRVTARGTVEIIRFLHDSMDVARHLP